MPPYSLFKYIGNSKWLLKSNPKTQDFPNLNERVSISQDDLLIKLCSHKNIQNCYIYIHLKSGSTITVHDDGVKPIH